MRSVRAAVHTVLPLIALAALGALGTMRGTASSLTPLELVSQGSGNVAPLVIVRVVTDGHPTIVTIPVQQASVAAQVAPSPLPLPRTVTRSVTRPSRHVATAPRPVTSSAPTPAAVPQPVATDSYPYADDTTNGMDAWGFTKRQCVSYVAWRLADAGRPIDNPTQRWGSALDWDDAAQRLGYAVSSQPHVGAVAQWNAHEDGPYWASGSSTANGSFVAGSMGHVAWVTKVYSDGSVLVAQYNGTSDRSYSTMRVKAPRYLSL